MIPDSDKVAATTRHASARTGAVADGGPIIITPTDPSEENDCEVTTYVTTTTVEGTSCGCPPHHTWEQAQNVTCDCDVQPTQGRTYYIYYSTYFCPKTPAGGTIGTSDNGGATSGPPPAGSTVSADYPPVSCNADPNYTMPTTPPPPGQSYMVPCSQVQLPIQSTPSNESGIPLAPKTKTRNLIDWFNLDPYLGNHLSVAAVTYLNNNQLVAEDMYKLLAFEDPEVKTKGQWAIEYLASNPMTNYTVFRNQFLFFTADEGNDGTFDATYWNNPSLTFPQQTLPTYTAYAAAYPNYDALTVYTLIGGPILAARNADLDGFTNACAARVSRALNYSGVTIPQVPNTFKGADGKNYFVSASALRAWMIKTFPNYSTYTYAQGGTKGENFPTLLANKKGIYMLTPNYPAKFGATGHADGWDGTKCFHECYFGAIGGVAYINFWTLTN